MGFGSIIELLGSYSSVTLPEFNESFANSGNIGNVLILVLPLYSYFFNDVASCSK